MADQPSLKNVVARNAKPILIALCVAATAGWLALVWVPYTAAAVRAELRCWWGLLPTWRDGRPVCPARGGAGKMSP
jgi:hypothetical protein